MGIIDYDWTVLNQVAWQVWQTDSGRDLDDGQTHGNLSLSMRYRIVQNSSTHVQQGKWTKIQIGYRLVI